MSGFAAIYGEVLRIGERLSAAWAGQLTTLLGRLPEGRVGNLDQIGAARMAALEALAARLPTGRTALIDALGTGVPTARVVASGVVATLTDTGPPERIHLGGGRYDFPPKPERWIADVTIPAVNPARCFVDLQGSCKIDSLTDFRRPACARVLNATTLRVYADFTRWQADSFQSAVNLEQGAAPSDTVSSVVGAHDLRWTLVEYV